MTVARTRRCINSRCGAKLENGDNGHCQECRALILEAISTARRAWPQAQLEDIRVSA